MSRLNAILLLVLVISSLYLVSKTYEGRRLFSEHQRELALAQQLQTDHERLLIERRAQATNLRVERVARERLNMVNGGVQNTQVVSGPALAAPASGASQ